MVRTGSWLCSAPVGMGGRTQHFVGDEKLFGREWLKLHEQRPALLGDADRQPLPDCPVRHRPTGRLRNARGAAAVCNDFWNRLHGSYVILDFKSTRKPKISNPFAIAAQYVRDMTWHDRLRRLVKDKELTMADLSRLSGVPYDSVNKYLRGDIQQPRGNTLDKLAAALETTTIYLTNGLTDRKPLPANPIPIRGSVAAGVWLEAGEKDLEPADWLPFNPVPQFPHESVYCLKVQGDSLDKVAPEGSTLVCVDLHKGGITIRDGDLVVVQRTREQGGLVEVTAKRVHQVPGGYELRPESSNPRWKPIFLDRANHSDVETVAVLARVEYVMHKP